MFYSWVGHTLKLPDEIVGRLQVLAVERYEGDFETCAASMLIGAVVAHDSNIARRKAMGLPVTDEYVEAADLKAAMEEAAGAPTTGKMDDDIPF